MQAGHSAAMKLSTLLKLHHVQSKPSTPQKLALMRAERKKR